MNEDAETRTVDEIKAMREAILKSPDDFGMYERAYSWGVMDALSWVMHEKPKCGNWPNPTEGGR